MLTTQNNPWVKDFPILAADENGNRLVYLDSAATAQRPASVLQAEKEFYEQANANPLRGLYELGVEATDRYEAARERVRKFLNARSDAEIMRFCQAFMLELWRCIGPDQDIPAGDVGVGGREIGFLNGMYQKLARQYHTGVLTGKGATWGGSILRPEATGFGALYFTQHLLHKAGKDIAGQKVCISGFGNVAWGAVKKATQLGAKVVAISGPDGVCHIPEGMTPEMNEYMLDMRASNRNMVEDLATKFPGQVQFIAGKKAWSIPCDIALPCAFQNELSEDDAKELKANGCWCCCEVSNMGCQPGAIHFFQNNGVLFAPGKAVNAGGVATSGLEMTQNAVHLSWSAQEVDDKLHWIMQSIHEQCVKYGTRPDGSVDYVKGANIAGFMKVAQAMLEQGII